jgi:hypothetical protein
MRDSKRTILVVTAFAAMSAVAVQDANAVPIRETYRWDHRVQVDVTFYPEEDVTGTALDETPGVADNLFSYTLVNLLEPMVCVPPCPPVEISGFRVGNPDDLFGVMFSPPGWSASIDSAGDFFWETSDPAMMIGVSQALRGFMLFSTGASGESERNGLARFGLRDPVDTSGPLSGPTSPSQAPEPSSLLLLGSSMAALAFSANRHRIRRR